jgi:hypothetical protein
MELLHELRHHSPGSAHANPTLAAGPGDEAAGITECLARPRLRCGGPKLWSLNVALDGGTEAPMSAERGWIGEPQPARPWHDCHYSRMADRIAARDREVAVTNNDTHD